MKKDTNKSAPKITRRDFVAGTLVGIGGGAMFGHADASSTLEPPAQPPSSFPPEMGGYDWNGYAGVGDYAKSNGNIASVRDTAHLVRDGLTEELMKKTEDTGEEYDMVIIGGGFSGLGAAYQFHKKYGDKKKCLIIENHPVFGGEAKMNEFEVDGYKIFGPQASNDFGPPAKDSKGLIADIYRDTGLPFEFDFVKQDPNKTTVRTPLENYYGLIWEEERYDTGYYMGKDAETPWVINPKKDGMDTLPWSDELKAEMKRLFADVEKHNKGDDLDRWLDSMSYKDLLEKELGYSPEVTKYLDPILAISMGGVGCDVYSGYSAKNLDMPGTENPWHYDSSQGDHDVGAYSFPGGNSGIYRHIAKYLIPDCITGEKTFENILENPINFDALDQPKNPINIRLNATAIDVRHAGSAENADHVEVTYKKDGKIRRVKAKTAVLSVGGWVARRIVSDMPTPIKEAYYEFHHSPILVANVALHNWRFLDKLGISQGRWFEGFGNFFSIRRPMKTGKNTQPFDPDKPIVMTYYVPFNKPGFAIKEQGLLGRMELLSKSYYDYEKEIVDQMTAMFADYGFKAERDIAGIVLNRWGHAYISPQPGFHFGKDGKEAPKEIVKKGFGRIQFGHSELAGYMAHTIALNEGSKAATKAMKLI